MNRHRRELNQRLAQMQAQIDDLSDSGPSRSIELDLLSQSDQTKALRQGNVYNGRVYK